MVRGVELALHLLIGLKHLCQKLESSLFSDPHEYLSKLTSLSQVLTQSLRVVLRSLQVTLESLQYIFECPAQNVNVYKQARSRIMGDC